MGRPLFTVVDRVTGRWQDHRFWLRQSCPTCGYCAEPAYGPDLLGSSVNFKCQRPDGLCGTQWSMAVDHNGKQKIRKLLLLATEADRIQQRLIEIGNEADALYAA